MKLFSSVFENSEQMPSKYTCDAEDISPPLLIKDVSDSCVSLALIVDDPDAPMGNWVHWLVWNIHSSIHNIEEHSVPDGAILGKTSFGSLVYGGPCPPSGVHRYFFKLYALDIKLDLQEGANKAELEQAMKGHIVDSCELMGLYGR